VNYLRDVITGLKEKARRDACVLESKQKENARRDARELERKQKAQDAVRSDDFLKPIWLNLRLASRFPIKQAAALSCGLNPQYAWVIEFPVEAEGAAHDALMLARERLDFLIQDRGCAPGSNISLSELAKLLLAEDESAYLPVEFPGRRSAAAPRAHQSCALEARQSAIQDAPALNLSTPSSSAKGAPLRGLSTKEIAECFGDCTFTTAQWPKRLSESKWLEPFRLACGEQGGASAIWCPLGIAQAMHERASAKRDKETLLKRLAGRFTKAPSLEPWRDAFNSYAAMFSDID
jgi:hypothetical protein